jgi:hypothetical protein
MTENEPRTRMRINHTRTIKNGWDYESTVEIEYPGYDDAAHLVRLADLLDQVREVAERERDARNRHDAARPRLMAS